MFIIQYSPTLMLLSGNHRSVKILCFISPNSRCILFKSRHMVSAKHMKSVDIHKSKINIQHHFNYDSCCFYMPMAYRAELIGSIRNGTLQFEGKKVVLTGYSFKSPNGSTFIKVVTEFHTKFINIA